MSRFERQNSQLFHKVQEKSMLSVLSVFAKNSNPWIHEDGP